MTEDSALLRDLNPEQAEAVATLEGPLLVIAGAGSGKTRVITRRIARMIESGIPASTILAVTFTNKAAREMRERVAALTGHGAWISTFHSFGARFLRTEAERLGRPTAFSLFDRADSEFAIKACLDELELDKNAYPPRSLLETIGTWKSNLKTPDDAATEAVSPWEEDVVDVYRRYETNLARNAAFDFDDLLCKSAMLLQRDEDLRRQMNLRFRYILVDEYQDVNSAQFQLTELLSRDHGNVCVTGDPDQCIYSWRGADISYILDFVERFDGAKVVQLEQNYRSVNNILKAASAVIRYNERCGEKDLWSERGDGDPIVIRRVCDDIEEARAVVERVQTLTASGVPRSDIAVFYRVNSLSLPIERQLMSSGIPYQVYRGLEFFKRKEVKDVLAYLRLLVNPDDEVSLKRVINTPTRGIGAKTVERLEKLSRAHELSLGRVLMDADLRQSVLSARAAAAVTAFCALLETLRSLDGDSTSQVIREIVDATGYGEFLTVRESKQGGDPLGNVEQLIVFAREIDRDGERPGVEGFLEEVSLFTDIDAMEAGDDKVVLMTMHSAKGLEFPHVVIVGMDDEIFPHKGVFRQTDEEEERRLFYVGLTRAMDTVTLLTADQRTRFGRPQISKPSIFLSEVPEEFSVVLDDVAGRHDADMSRRVDYEIEDDFRIQRGARVRHASFGNGVVTGISGRGGDARVTIDFEDGDRRKFVLRYAGLEPLDYDV